MPSLNWKVIPLQSITVNRVSTDGSLIVCNSQRPIQLLPLSLDGRAWERKAHMLMYNKPSAAIVSLPCREIQPNLVAGLRYFKTLLPVICICQLTMCFRKRFHGLAALTSLWWPFYRSWFCWPYNHFQLPYQHNKSSSTLSRVTGWDTLVWPAKDRPAWLTSLRCVFACFFKMDFSAGRVCNMYSAHCWSSMNEYSVCLIDIPEMLKAKLKIIRSGLPIY